MRDETENAEPLEEKDDDDAPLPPVDGMSLEEIDEELAVAFLYWFAPLTGFSLAMVIFVLGYYVAGANETLTKLLGVAGALVGGVVALRRGVRVYDAAPRAAHRLVWLGTRLQRSSPGTMRERIDALLQAQQRLMSEGSELRVEG